MLIAEALSLIALNPTRGLAEAKFSALHDRRVLTAALMLELAAQMRIGIHHGRVRVLDALPSRHPLLSMALKILGEQSGQLKTSDALHLLVRRMRSVRTELLDGLARRDILHPPTRQFLFFGPKRFPVRSIQAQNEAMQLVKRAADGVDTNLTALALLSMSVASGCIDFLLTFEDAENAKARLRQLHDEIDAQIEVSVTVQAKDDDSYDEIYSVALIAELELEVRRLLKA